jgi:hypothetical protein
MPATVQIHEMTALAAGVNKISGTIRFKSADETVVDSTNRLRIPAETTLYSYTKQLRFYFSVAPVTSVTNLIAYSDGASGLGTGVGIQYDVPGTTWAANINTSIAGTNLFTKVSTAPIDLDAGPHTSTGYKGSLLRLQMSVAKTASPGALSPGETITFAYDET